MNSLQFQELEAEVIERLCPLGYVRGQNEIDGPFESHFVDYTHNDQAYRLVADGKESKVVVEFSASYSRAIPHQGWALVLDVPYPRTFNATGLLLLRQGISLAVAHHRHSAA